MRKEENNDPKDVQRKGKAKMQLKRNIGYFDGVSFIIGSIVGAGIFVSPTGVLKHSLLNVGVALTIWTASGLVSLMGALCYAELGTALPFSGGEYSHIKRGLGSLPAFVFIWTSTFTKPASNAARALLFAEYATQPFYGICPAPDVLKKCLALAVLWSLGILNGLSVKMSAWVQTVFTLLKMMALSVIAVGGIVLLVTRQKESLARFEDMFSSEIPNASQVAEAFFQGLYAYGGWWSLNYMAGILLLFRFTSAVLVFLSLFWENLSLLQDHRVLLILHKCLLGLVEEALFLSRENSCFLCRMKLTFSGKYKRNHNS